MRRIVSQARLIGLLAAVLTFGLVAAAWAATTVEGAGGDTQSAALDESQSEGFMPGDGGGFMMGEDIGGRGRGGMHGGMGGEIGRGMAGAMMDDPALREQMEEQMEERRALIEERRDAFHAQLRAEMNTEDQAKFDELLGQLEQRREALDQAREAVREMGSQVRDLVEPYLPIDRGDATVQEDDGSPSASDTGV
ncbi:MAG TPA: hypothetical protein VFE20_01980 [Thermoleophilia bacterium]|nr:hypothetical protein [Thermoleophilia bacterium]